MLLSESLLLLVVAGFTDTEVGCVKFGLITEETDIVELLTLVQSTGKDVEDSMKVGHIYTFIFWVLFYITVGREI